MIIKEHRPDENNSLIVHTCLKLTTIEILWYWVIMFSIKEFRMVVIKPSLNQAFWSCKRCIVIICNIYWCLFDNCFLPVLIVDTVDVDSAHCEADVDNDEDEEEDKDVHHHVAHWDDDWSNLPVHQPNLREKESLNLITTCFSSSWPEIAHIEWTLGMWL